MLHVITLLRSHLTVSRAFLSWSGLSKRGMLTAPREPGTSHGQRCPSDCTGIPFSTSQVPVPLSQAETARHST